MRIIIFAQNTYVCTKYTINVNYALHMHTRYLISLINYLYLSLINWHVSSLYDADGYNFSGKTMDGHLMLHTFYIRVSLIERLNLAIDQESMM